MENYVITIPIETSMDPSQLLDLIYEIAERLSEEIESYNEEAEIDECEISVEAGD